jgi:hypothetical protein
MFTTTARFANALESGALIDRNHVKIELSNFAVAVGDGGVVR